MDVSPAKLCPRDLTGEVSYKAVEKLMQAPQRTGNVPHAYIPQ